MGDGGASAEVEPHCWVIEGPYLPSACILARASGYWVDKSGDSMKKFGIANGRGTQGFVHASLVRCTSLLFDGLQMFLYGLLRQMCNSKDLPMRCGVISSVASLCYATIRLAASVFTQAPRACCLACCCTSDRGEKCRSRANPEISCSSLRATQVRAHDDRA